MPTTCSRQCANSASLYEYHAWSNVAGEDLNAFRTVNCAHDWPRLAHQSAASTPYVSDWGFMRHTCFHVLRSRGFAVFHSPKNGPFSFSPRASMRPTNRVFSFSHRECSTSAAIHVNSWSADQKCDCHAAAMSVASSVGI